MFWDVFVVSHGGLYSSDDIEAPPLPHERDPFLAWKV